MAHHGARRAGAKDRTVPVPQRLRVDPAALLDQREAWHVEDLRLNMADVELPNALHRKYPQAARQLAGKWAFASTTIAPTRRAACSAGITLYDQTVQRPMARAVKRAGIRRTRRRTRCVTASPRTCCSKGTTSDRCRSCWACRRQHDHDLHPSSRHWPGNGVKSPLTGCSSSTTEEALARDETAREHQQPRDWIKLQKYRELTGDSADAVHARRRKRQWSTAGSASSGLDGNVDSPEEVNRWVESNPQPSES